MPRLEVMDLSALVSLLSVAVSMKTLVEKSLTILYSTEISIVLVLVLG
jgi:hypothetical protein